MSLGANVGAEEPRHPGSLPWGLSGGVVPGAACSRWNWNAAGVRRGRFPAGDRVGGAAQLTHKDPTGG